MQYAQWYRGTIVGDIYLTSNGTELTGAFFDGHQRFFAPSEDDILGEDLPIFQQASAWLDTYFAGEDPGALPPISLKGLSPFRRMVCEEMMGIPYGETTTYGAIAKALARRTGKQKMSAQAVGGGVGHNPVGIIIPCHRVVGTNKSLTGYGGGMYRKIALLELEGIDMSQFTVPTKGTAL